MEEKKIGEITGKKYQREVSGNIYNQFQFSVPKEVRERLPEEIELEVYQIGEDIVLTTDNQLIIKEDLKERRDKLKSEIKELKERKKQIRGKMLTYDTAKTIYRILTGKTPTIDGQRARKRDTIKLIIQELEKQISP